MKTTLLPTLVVLLTLLANASRVGAQGTDFTYQGRLLDNGTPANGSFDLQFLLFDALDGGVQQGVTLSRFGTEARDGLFTTTLGFGPGIFTGPLRWLEIRVAPLNTANFTTLRPRQALTPAPYAMYAPEAGTAATASRVAWTAVTGIPSGLADGVDDNTTYVAGSGLTLAGQSFSLNTAVTDARYWKLAGNSGTTPGVNFLGTTDNRALEIKVNGLRALRLEPNEFVAPNVIGGAPGNFVDAGVAGATIAGGGAMNYAAGGFVYTNSVLWDFGTVGGGLANRIAPLAFAGTIAGGEFNDIGRNAGYSAIGGGRYNTIAANSEDGTITGGTANNIAADSTQATIAGGTVNNIGTHSSGSAIGGGIGNTIQPDAGGATIAGGDSNTIQTNADYATIPGGSQAQARLFGQMAHASGAFEAFGDAQTSCYVLRRTTTSASTNELFLNGVNRRMTVPTDGVWSFDILIAASSGNEYAGYHLRGLIVNYQGLVAVAGTPVKTLLYEDDPTWDANVDEDIPNSALVIKVRGAAGTTIRWVATVRTVEVIF